MTQCFVGDRPDRPEIPLAEVISRQLPFLPADCDRITVQLGWRDILDGCDESYIHARLVELCDVLRGHPAHIEIRAIPQRRAVTSQQTELRRQCNAAARVTAELRGLKWSADTD